MTAIRALRHIDSDDMPWRRHAACINTGPATFYPERDGNDVVADIVRAKAICASCPVRDDCLEHALQTNELFGVWGGHTFEERRSIRRKRRREERAAAGPMPRRIVDAPVHNYSTYCNRGCRCEVCTEAMRTQLSLRRERRREERAAAGPMPRRIVDAPVHNYSTYCNRGCRCEVCTEAMRTRRELRHG